MTSEPPLRGVRVLVTRQPDRARDLIDGLTRLGATVAAIPLIETRPPDDPAPLHGALARLPSYDWLVFTSANAVQAVRLSLDSLGIGFPKSLRVASVGRVTSAACVSLLDRAPDLEPVSDFRAEGLLAAFAQRGDPPSSLLLPVSSRARDVLVVGLRTQGWQVDRVVAYHTDVPEASAERLREALRLGVDLVVFASPSAVETFRDAAGDRGPGIPAAVIGPTTAAAAAAAGIEVRITASPATADGLLHAIARHYVIGSGSPP